jgi:type I restriction enzyme, S subunit
LDKGDKSRYISEDTFKRLKCTEVFEEDILISRLPDPVGRACLISKLDTRAITAVDCTIVRFEKEKVDPKFFVIYSMSSDYFDSLEHFLTGSSRSRISRSNLAKVKIPFPPLEIQKQLVAEAEKEEEIIAANHRLIDLMERKIEKLLNEI